MLDAARCQLPRCSRGAHIRADGVAGKQILLDRGAEQILLVDGVSCWVLGFRVERILD